MADADEVRRIALALPDVREIDSDGFDFRVAGKGFVWSYPERTPGRARVIRTDVAVLFVGDEAEKQALLLGEPERFFTTAGYDGVPLVLLRLPQVDVERLTELVTDAWRMRVGSDVVADEVPVVAPQQPARQAATTKKAGPLELEFSGEIFHWRGPAPHHFVTVPDDGCAALHAVASQVTYGWGMIPVVARTGSTSWTTSLFPKDGRFLVPMKADARKTEGLEVGDVVTIHLVVAPRTRAKPGQAS